MRLRTPTARKGGRRFGHRPQAGESRRVAIACCYQRHNAGVEQVDHAVVVKQLAGGWDGRDIPVGSVQVERKPVHLYVIGWPQGPATAGKGSAEHQRRHQRRAAPAELLCDAVPGSSSSNAGRPSHSSASRP